MPHQEKHLIDPNSWFAFGLSVVVSDPSYLEWPDAPWLQPMVGVGEDEDESARQLAFKRAESPYIPAIESAIDEWLKTGTRPPLADVPLHFFALRRQVVGTLFISFDSVSEVLPPPKREDRQRVARKFLIDWWRTHGAMYAVGFTLSECDR